MSDLSPADLSLWLQEVPHTFAQGVALRKLFAAERAAALEEVRLLLREEVAKLKDQLAQATCQHCGKYVFYQEQTP